MINEGEDAGTRISVESESDALSTIPAIETPSSSPSPIGSPTVELVVQSEDELDFGGHDPPVAIIDDDTDFGLPRPVGKLSILGRRRNSE